MQKKSHELNKWIGRKNGQKWKTGYYHILFTHNDVTKCKSIVGSRLVLVNTDVDLYDTYVKDENEFNDENELRIDNASKEPKIKFIEEEWTLLAKTRRSQFAFRTCEWTWCLKII